MSLLPKPNRKTFILLSTAGIIAVIFFLYFYGYVATNERKLVDRGYRILAQVAENIEARENSYQQNLNFTLQSYGEELYAKVIDDNEIKFYTGEIRTIAERIRLLTEENERLEDAMNAPLDGSYGTTTATRRSGAQRGNFEDNLEEIKELEEDIVQKENERFGQIKKAIMDSLNLLNRKISWQSDISAINKEFIRPIALDNYPPDSLLFQGQINIDQGNFIDDFYIVFRSGLKDFLDPIFRRNDFFDEYFVVRGDSAVAYQTFSNKITLERQDSLMNLSGGLGAGRIVQVNLFNRDYLVLSHKIDNPAMGKVLVGGLIARDRFRNEARKVGSFYLVIALLILLLSMIAMPTLKLLFMSSIEKLYMSNVTTVGASIILGAPLIFIISFCVYEFTIVEAERTDTQLQQLSKSITGSFESEMVQSLELLKSYTGKERLNSFAQRDRKQCDSVANDTLTYTFLFGITDGGELHNLETPFKNDNIQVNVSDRDYFNRARMKDTWRFEGDTSAYDNFYFQSIISKANFSTDATISMTTGNENYPATAMVVFLNSLMSPILPVGFHFVVLSQEGEVLMHSTPEKNLQENFLQEVNNDSDLISALHARRDVWASFNYQNINHKAYVTPINKMPIYLVTYFDLRLRNAAIIQIATLSAIFLFGSFVLVVLQLLMAYQFHYRQTRLKMRTFTFDWLRPRFDGAHINIYRELIITFVLVGVLMVIYSFFITDFDKIFVFLVINAFLFSRSHARLNQRSWERNFFTTIIVLLLLVHLYCYKTYYGEIVWRHLVNIGFPVLLLGVKSAQRRLHWLARRVRYVRTPFFLRRFDFHHQSAFQNYMFTWLFVGSIMPTFYIFNMAHDAEGRVWEKHNQLHIAQTFEDKVWSLTNKYNDFCNEKERQLFINQKIDSGNYLLQTQMTAKLSTDSAKELGGSSQNEMLDLILFYLRVPYNELIKTSKGLVYDQSTNNKRSWSMEASDSLYLRYEFDKNVTWQGNDFMYLNSGMENYRLLRSDAVVGNISFGFLCLIILWGIYNVIGFVISRVFGTSYEGYQSKLKASVPLLRQLLKANYIYLLGTPKSGKSHLTSQLRFDQTVNMLKIRDEEQWNEYCATLELKKGGSYRLENFEFDHSTDDCNKRRVEFLKELLLLKPKRLILVSEVHPSVFSELYEEKLVGATNDKERDYYRSMMELWRHIFSGFILIYNPVSTRVLNLDWVKNNELKELLKVEIGRGNYLPKLLELMKIYFFKKKEGDYARPSTAMEDSRLLKEFVVREEHDFDDEEVILKIQNLAGSYYYGLWNSLDKNEKYLMYDLASDRFVNINNQTAVRSLIDKGLISYDNGLKVMNQSFANFVLSIVTREEVLLMKKEVTNKGSWSIISSVLVLILISLVVFIFLGNPNLFDDFNAILGVFGAVLGLLPRLSRLLTSANVTTAVAGD